MNRLTAVGAVALLAVAPLAVPGTGQMLILTREAL